MNTAAPSQSPVRLNRHSFLPGDPEQILLHQVPQNKYPTEVIVFERLHKPMRSHTVETPPNVPTMNGQYVDLATMLMCAKCGQWKLDEEFRMDTHNGAARRGRRCYCRRCLSKNPVYLAGEIDDVMPPRGRPKKKDKKKKDKKKARH